MRKNALKACVGLLAAGLILGGWVFVSLGRWFQHSDEPAPADLIVVLCGDPTRSLKAAELYRAGLAPEVWVGRPVREPWLARLERIGFVLPPEEEMHKQALVKHGVPENRIHFYGTKNLSTTQEASELAAALGARRGLKIMLVSSRTHCRRAKMIFSRHLKGSRVSAVAANEDPPKARWWKDKFLAQEVVMETLRTAFNALGGRFTSPP
ncbi:MAG: YdcF family protein [Elusimicrobiota bacterium]